MAATVQPSTGFIDEFTSIWSQLYTLYAEEVFWEHKLCHEGYRGYPEPQYDMGGVEFTPDLLGFHQDGDAHHVSVESFSELKQNGGYKNGRADQIEESMRNVEEFHDIPSKEVRNWLETTRGVDFEPSRQEVVALVPNKVFELYEEKFKDCANDMGVIIWAIRRGDPTGRELSTVEKRAGSHSNRRLERALSEEIPLYPHANNLLQFSRKTKTAYLKFAFVRILVSYCTRESKLEFAFDEVDEIMIQSEPPILGHLTRSTREEHWRKYLYSMLQRFALLEKADAENRYRWRKKKFLNEPRYQSRILEQVRGELEIGEKA